MPNISHVRKTVLQAKACAHLPISERKVLNITFMPTIAVRGAEVMRLLEMERGGKIKFGGNGDDPDVTLLTILSAHRNGWREGNNVVSLVLTPAFGKKDVERFVGFLDGRADTIEVVDATDESTDIETATVVA